MPTEWRRWFISEMQKENEERAKNGQGKIRTQDVPRAKRKE